MHPRTIGVPSTSTGLIRDLEGTPDPRPHLERRGVPRPSRVPDGRRAPLHPLEVDRQDRHATWCASSSRPGAATSWSRSAWRASDYATDERVRARGQRGGQPRGARDPRRPHRLGRGELGHARVRQAQELAVRAARHPPARRACSTTSPWSTSTPSALGIRDVARVSADEVRRHLGRVPDLRLGSDRGRAARRIRQLPARRRGRRDRLRPGCRPRLQARRRSQRAHHRLPRRPAHRARPDGGRGMSGLDDTLKVAPRSGKALQPRPAQRGRLKAVAEPPIRGLPDPRRAAVLAGDRDRRRVALADLPDRPLSGSRGRRGAARHRDRRARRAIPLAVVGADRHRIRGVPRRRRAARGSRSRRSSGVLPSCAGTARSGLGDRARLEAAAHHRPAGRRVPGASGARRCCSCSRSRSCRSASPCAPRWGELAVIPPIVLFLVGIVFGPERIGTPECARARAAGGRRCSPWCGGAGGGGGRRSGALARSTPDAEGRPLATAGETGPGASWHRRRGASSCWSPAEPRSRASSALPPASDRHVLRTAIAQPFDPRDYPSPLSGFRRYLRDDKTGQVQFRITGLPDGARIRIATLDSYDGVVYAVGSAAVDSASGHLRAHPVVGRPVGDDRARPCDLTVTSRTTRGSGCPRSAASSRSPSPAPTPRRLDDAFYYNNTSGTAAVLGGLHAGDSYTPARRAARRADLEPARGGDARAGVGAAPSA